MEKVIYNLVFNRKKRLNAEGKALIQVEAYLNRQKKYFSTKIYVKPTQWDSKRKAVRTIPIWMNSISTLRIILLIWNGSN